MPSHPPILLCAELEAAARQRWQNALSEALPEARWRWHDAPGDHSDTEIAVVANPPRGSLQGLPRLGFIQSLWAGVDRLLGDTSVPAHIPLARMVDPTLSEAMVQTALWATLSLHRGFFDYAQQQQAGLWAHRPQLQAGDLSITVLGLGNMGRAVALRLLAQGYAVTGWSARGADVPGVKVLQGFDQLPTALRSAQILINLLPLTPATQGLLNARTLRQLPPGAHVVNLARGSHVIEPDLLALLNEGHIARAVLDVFAQEPLPASHPFWQHPRVTLLPHAAALTDPRTAARVAAANITAWQNGQPVANLVDRNRGY